MRNGLTLREFEVLRALVDHGTTIAAAEYLGISQPAISRTLGQLEAGLGQELFLRQGGRLVPTAEARRIDAELETLFATLRRIEDPGAAIPHSVRPLYLAAPPTIAHSLLPQVVARFSREHPDQHVIVDVNSSDILVSYVADRRVDLAIVDTEPAHPGVLAEAFRSSEVVCLMPKDHPLAQKDVIRPADLDGQPFINHTRRHSVRAAQDNALFSDHAHPRSSIEVSTVVLAAELVRLGAGVALINPFPTVLSLDPALCTRPFEPQIVMNTWFMTPVANRPSAAVLALMALVRETAASMEKGYPK